MPRRLEMLDQFYFGVRRTEENNLPPKEKLNISPPRLTILQDAINKWGNEKQTIVAIEELSELIKELTKALRGASNKEHIASEMADVRIVCDEIKMMYGINDKDIEREENYKLQRLAHRIEEEQ